MNCPFCGDSLITKKRGLGFRVLARVIESVADRKRGTFMRARHCPKCGAKIVSAEVLFPEDRQREELHRLYSLRYYAKRLRTHST